MFDLEEELKKLPAKPGVYIMHDAHDAIIYVGKAISLKNRVRQYFQSSRGKSPKIQQMVANIAYFEYIVVDSEMEALVLECNLIKEHRPKYNTMLKDDKSYPYIRVTVDEPFPRVLYARRQKKDKSKYFGPFTNAYAVKETLELLRKTYQYRNCNKQLTGKKEADRPCLYHHIGQCKAPCQGGVTVEEYRKNIDEILEFLGGNYGILTKKLSAAMQEASENLEFEKAAEYRDLLNSVNKLSQQQKVSDTEGSNRDIIAFATAGDEAVVQVFFIRDGKMLGREHFYLTGVQHEERADIMADFIKQYYAGTPYIPRELLLGEALNEEDGQLIGDWLSKKRGGRVKILVPQRGEKERMIELAYKNASLVLQQDAEKIKREEARTTGAVRQIADWLGMAGICRFESYDISNTSGFESVGSMVVYENGRPKKNDYRKFRIRTVAGPDDYASMREVLTRRFLHAGKSTEGQEDSFSRFPDLILMDGGRGQVNVCLEVLSELGVDRVKVCGMVKDDHHRTRGLYYNNEEIPIDPGSEAFKLITRIQDETHRFAIEFHRSLRGKAQVHSVLDDIPGIGAVRRRALMKKYQSLEELKLATPEELAQLPEFNRRVANQVYEFFRGREEQTWKD